MFHEMLWGETGGHFGSINRTLTVVGYCSQL